MVPENLIVPELKTEREIGYFPLALVSVTLGRFGDGSYFSFLLYLAFSVSGFNLILGVSTRLLSVLGNLSNSTFRDTYI